MALLKNMTGKLTKNADKIGILAGSMIRGYQPLIDHAMLLISGQGHFPDVQRTVEAYFELPEFRPTILLWLGGYIAKELGYAKYGKPLQKFSEGMLKGMAIQHLLWWSTHADEGSAPEGVRSMFNRAVVAPNQGYNY